MRFAVALAALVACAPALEADDLCADGYDDDDDGLIDCRDPGCAFSPLCDRCGDGAIDPTVEACDDGNRADGDGCDAQCFKEGCGDGTRDEGEVCDDGNLVPGDGCDFRCERDRCGDGAIDPEEDCDDGNLRDGDGCTKTCGYERPETCGDFRFDPGEQCDDGNLRDEDGCNGACRFEFCGDGRVQQGLGERCDDGNQLSNDGCCFCFEPVCGDFSLCGDEQCDDGNRFDGDGCSFDCRFE